MRPSKIHMFYLVLFGAREEWSASAHLSKNTPDAPNVQRSRVFPARLGFYCVRFGSEVRVKHKVGVRDGV